MVSRRRQRVIDKGISPKDFRPECPHITRGQNVPVILCLKELLDRLALGHINKLLLNKLTDPLLKRTSEGLQSVLLVGGISVAGNTRSLDDRLREDDSRVGDTALNIAVELPNVVQDTVEVHLPVSNQDMFTTLFDFGLEHQVALVDSAEGLDHFGEFAGDQWLDGYFDGGLGPVLERDHDVDVSNRVGVRDGGSLSDGLINALN